MQFIHSNTYLAFKKGGSRIIKIPKKSLIKLISWNVCAAFMTDDVDNPNDSHSFQTRKKQDAILFVFNFPHFGIGHPRSGRLQSRRQGQVRSSVFFLKVPFL